MRDSGGAERKPGWQRESGGDGWSAGDVTLAEITAGNGSKIPVKVPIRSLSRATSYDIQ